MATQSTSREVRFGEFAIDLRMGELRRNGDLVKLQPQPAKVLAILASRAGEVVTRQDLSDQVWGSETHVDFEHGLNYAIRQIRSVLEDDSGHPRFLETIPKRGYRFIASVQNAAVAEEAQPQVVPLVETKRSGVTPRKILYATAAVVLAAIIGLTWYVRASWVGRASARQIRSLAVLPLRNLSNDPSQEYFSDGMTDELITDLAKVTKLRVTSHTSVERYKQTKRSLPEIARELGVDGIIEGTVMRSGDHVRITAQLIEAHSDRHLWADSYERDLRDVLALQDEVAKRIASEIGVKLTNHETSTFGVSKRKVDPTAYEAYLKGASYFDNMGCRDFENALNYFQMAIDKDPNFAPAYAGLADAYFTLGDWRCVHQEPFDRAEIAASKAIELEPGNAHAHAVLAEVGFSRDWNWIEPAEQFTTAIDLDPNNPGVHSYYGMFLVAMGKVDEGIAEEKKAQALDPLSDRTNLLYTWTLYLAHRFDEAIAQAQHALSISPSYGEYYWLGQCYEKKGMPDQAIAFYIKAMSGVPEEVPIRLAAYRKGGLAGYWREDEQIRKRTNAKVDAIREAMYCAHTGEKEKAILQLQLAYQHHVNGLQFLKVEPVYDSLRDDARFKSLLARLGL